MNSITILQCLSEEHPTYDTPNRTQKESEHVKASSTTTLKQDPPKVLVRKDLTTWIANANQFFVSTEARNSDLARHPGPFLGIPKTMENEADVVRMGNKQILDLVVDALNVKYPKLHLSEFSESKVGQLRVDLSVKTKKARKDGRLAVLLLEYKNCGYINYDNFDEALVNENDVQETLKQLDMNRLDSTLPRKGNARVFIQQITAYHARTGCRYAALCDYEHLVLIRYLGDDNLEQADVALVDRKDMRKALLGFAIEACEDVTNHLKPRGTSPDTGLVDG
jgi:hypothetical protein